MPPPVGVPGTSTDPQIQVHPLGYPQVQTPTPLKAYEASVKILADPTSKDEAKLQAAQELNENFEVI